MRLLVVGAGAIGCWLGHRLVSTGHRVTLVGRPAWIEAVRARGLGLQVGDNVQRVHDLVAATDIGTVSGETFDWVFCTVKAYDTLEALRPLSAVVRENTPLLLVQNGVGGEELAAQVWPQALFVSGVVTLAVQALAPGAICLTTTRGGLALAAVSPGAPVEALADELRRAGLTRLKLYPDYRAVKWSKLLLNMLGNALPTLLDMPLEALYAHRWAFELERAAFGEALAVMRHLGIGPVSLPGYAVPLFAWAMARLPGAALQPLFRRLVIGGRGGKMPSLHLDLARGKPRSEVGFLNGAVAAHGQALGLPAAVNRALASTLQAIVSGELSWDEFRGRPERFLSRLDGQF
ncbi:MAG: ketopantoate reductase family protein [Chloroflexota bacterium]